MYISESGNQASTRIILKTTILSTGIHCEIISKRGPNHVKKLFGSLKKNGHRPC